MRYVFIILVGNITGMIILQQHVVRAGPLSKPHLVIAIYVFLSQLYFASSRTSPNLPPRNTLSDVNHASPNLAPRISLFLSYLVSLNIKQAFKKNLGVWTEHPVPNNGRESKSVGYQNIFRRYNSLLQPTLQSTMDAKFSATRIGNIYIYMEAEASKLKETWQSRHLRIISTDWIGPIGPIGRMYG